MENNLTPEEKEKKWIQSVNSKFENATKKMKNDVHNGTSVFLPTKKQLENAKSPNSEINIYPQLVRKAVDGKVIIGMNQLIAQQNLTDAGLKNEGRNFDVITFDQATKIGAFIKKNEDGSYPLKMDLLLMNNANNPAYYSVYSAANVKNPQTLPKLIDRKKFELQTFKTENSNVDEYLGKYLAATNQGGKFVTTKKIAEEFQANLEKRLSTEIEKGNYKSIIGIGADANKVAKVTLGKLYDRGISKDKDVDINKDISKEKTQEFKRKSPAMSMA